MATTKPFAVSIDGTTFHATTTHDTETQAYTEARRIRDLAAKHQPVTLTDEHGNTHTYRGVLAIRIFKWNPHAGMRIAHCRGWSLNYPRPGMFAPLPDAFYDGIRLPADWRARRTPTPA